MTARASRFAIPRRIAGGAVAALLLLAACESKLPTSSEIEAMDAKSVVKAAAALPGVDPTRTTYLLDGTPVNRADAERVLTGNIASIEVVRGNDRASQIRVRTTGRRIALRTDNARTMGDSSFVVTLDTLRVLGPTVIDSVRRVTGYMIDSAGRPFDSLSHGNDSTRSRIRVRGMASGSMAAISANRMAYPSASGERLPTLNGVIVVIDGVIRDQKAMGSISPDEIESVEVIKGASATALYGPLAANGVISVKTKRR